MRVDQVPPASAGGGAQSNQTLGLYAASNTTGASSSSTFDARSITFQGAGIASVGYSNGSVVFSVPSGGGAGDGVNILAAGTQTAATTGTVLFNNSNGITFGMSNSSVITASHNGLTSQSNQAFSASGGSSAFQTLNFANSNGITFSNSNGSVIASHNGLTTARASTDAIGLNTAQSNVTWTVNSSGLSLDARGYAGTGTSATNISLTLNSNGLAASVASQTNQSLGLYAVSNTTGASSSSTFDARSISFQGAGIASVGYSNGSVVVSVPAGGGGGDGVNILAAGGSTAATTGTYVFSNSNGVSFSLNGSTITASHNGLTSQSNQALSAGNGSFAFQTASFSNANGISFSTSAGSAIVASHNGLTTARASNDGIGLATAQSNVTWTVNSAGLSLDARGYAGTGTTFAGANLSGSITLNSNGINLSMSAGAPGGGGAVNFSAGTTSQDLQSVVFSNSNGVSFGLNGSTITASVGAGGGGGTLSYWSPTDEREMLNANHGQGTIHINPGIVPNLTFDRVALGCNFSNATNSTGTITVTMSMGIYTQNASTLSLLTSNSQTVTLPYSGNASNNTNFGPRNFTIPMSTSLSEGNYWFAVVNSTASAGANATFNQYVATQVNSNWSGIFGAVSASSAQAILGLGYYSAASAAFPSSIAFSQIRGTASLALRPPVFHLINGTA